MFNDTTLPIGLDISDLSLKAIQLNKKGEKISITGVGKYILKTGVIDNGEIINQEEFTSAIKQMLDKPVFGSFNTNEVIACLPDVKTFIKLIEMEKSPNKIESQVSLELEKNFPFSHNEVYYDWQIIEKGMDANQILVSASPKNTVEQYISVLKSSKLQVSALEAEPIAIARSLLKEESPKKNPEKPKNYCLIDIGAKRTGLTIYSKNTIVSSVSLPISGDETTKLIASSLEIKEDEAEKAKIICGLDKEQAHGIIANILSEMTDTLIKKIEQTVNFFYKHYPSRGEIDEILLCGGGSNIRLLDQTITECLGILTKSGDPLINLGSNNEEISKIFLEKHKIDTRNMKNLEDNFLVKKQSSVTNYSTAIGLALRNCFITKI